MSAFSIAPITNVPPPDAEDFPDYIQFRNHGEDLGGPDASVLDFSTGLTATRGVGENSNVVTVVGVAPPPGVLVLTSNPDPSGPIMAFDNVVATDIWAAGAARVPSEDWEWNGFDELLTFLRAGYYQIVATNYIEADAGVWPAGATTYGSQIGDPNANGSIGSQARFRDAGNPEDTRIRMTWTDQHVVNVETDGEEMAVGLFASAETTGDGVLFAGMTAVITRLSDPI